MKAVAIVAVLAVLGMALAQDSSLTENVSLRKGGPPPPKKHYCSYYADMYKYVFLYDYKNKKCYELYIDGYTKVGYVCVSIVSYKGKTCIAFKFYAADKYKFTGLYAGASSDCSKPVEKPYTVKGYYGSTLYVCLDTFYAYGDTGCCNSDICLYFKVDVKKYICKYYYDYHDRHGVYDKYYKYYDYYTKYYKHHHDKRGYYGYDKYYYDKYGKKYYYKHKYYGKLASRSKYYGGKHHGGHGKYPYYYYHGKYYKYYKCYYDTAEYWGYPSGKVCPKWDFYYKCSAPLVCSNGPLPPHHW